MGSKIVSLKCSTFKPKKFNMQPYNIHPFYG